MAVAINKVSVNVAGQSVDVEIEKKTHPKPVPEPLLGVRMMPGMNFARVIHDDLDPQYYYNGLPGARTLWLTIAMTNELRRARVWDGNKVFPYSDVKFMPENLSGDWPEYFFSQLSELQHALSDENWFGWRDGVPEEDGMPNPWKMLLTGGELIRTIGRYKEFTLFTCQNTDHPPEYSTPEARPDRWLPQGVCGHNKQTKVPYWGKVNPVQGRFFYPLACPGGIAALETAYLRQYPSLPWSTLVDGYPMTFIEFCFVGAEWLGLADDGNWYYLLQQVAKNGNQADFLTHVSTLPPLPVPFVDWQKT